ncbi:phage holin family protein [Metallibacterium scheffleri]|uniref:Phage holin family protein n=1 Tax=Metallibacterium scheffleri TaxID=993689 RepID=A0A4S3KRV0_9GAMM|nr:phage holin family protein [Metallibacterium scheffleri]THD11835.1 hypothetical protein B1806_01780 [Metallibacterium scheffleri]
MTEAEEPAAQVDTTQAPIITAPAPTDTCTAVPGALDAVIEMGAALLGLARLEAGRAGRGLLWALLFGIAIVVLVASGLLLLVALLLLGLVHASGSLVLALVLTILVLIVGVWLLLRGLRRVLRPLSLPATRAELRAVLEPLRSKPPA